MRSPRQLDVERDKKVSLLAAHYPVQTVVLEYHFFTLLSPPGHPHIDLSIKRGHTDPSSEKCCMQWYPRVVVKVNPLSPEEFRGRDPNANDKITGLAVTRDRRIAGSGDTDPHAVFDACDEICLET